MKERFIPPYPSEKITLATNPKVITPDDLPSVRQLHSDIIIGFLTGCFDILHDGHLIHLRQSRGFVGENGILVVGVNSDTSVTQLKGPNRPHNPESVRLKNLLDTDLVDYAFIFSDLNAANLLKLLSPDVYVTFKELDRNNLFDKPEIIALAELETVLRINVDFARGPDGERISTTRILQQMTKSSR